MKKNVILAAKKPTVREYALLRRIRICYFNNELEICMKLCDEKLSDTSIAILISSIIFYQHLLNRENIGSDMKEFIIIKMIGINSKITAAFILYDIDNSKKGDI